MCICIDSLIDSASYAGQCVRGLDKKPAKDAILEKTWDMQWKVDRRCSGMGRLRSVTVANTRILRDCKGPCFDNVLEKREVGGEGGELSSCCIRTASWE